MEKIPTDNRIRSMLDEVSPDALQRCFDHVVEQLRERDGLKAFQRLAGRILVTLDGTEYFCSQKLSCPQCLTRKRTNGKTEHYHAMLAAVIVAPGQNMVLPLMPEFITPQDGAEKQDCERNGANLAHNFGHGKKYLARIFAAMNLLALAFHTACVCLGNALATSPRGKRNPHPLLRAHPNHFRLRRLPLLAQTHEYAHLLQSRPPALPTRGG